MKNRQLAILLGCVLLSTATGAADLYRWVDENGHTSVSDNVPVRYRDVATKIDTGPSEISESRRQEAWARAAREKQRTEEARAESTQANPAALSKTGELKPPRNDKDVECEALIRAYRESQECFAPFKLRRPDGSLRRDGAVREEAYRYCKSIPDPFRQCVLPAAN